MIKDKTGQSNVIAVVILVGVSLVVGVSMVALFSAQSAAVSSRVDVSDVVAAAKASEFGTVVYRRSVIADPANPSAGFNNTVLFKLVLLHYGRRFFLFVPVIITASEGYLHIDLGDSLALWRNASVQALIPQASGAGYATINLTPVNVSGGKIVLDGGLPFGLSQVPVFRVETMNTTPYPSAYVLIKFTSPPSWSGYDLSLITLVEVNDKYFEVESVTTPIGGS